MPDTITIADRVRKLIAKHLGVEPERATDDADLIDDLGADSLDVIEVVLKIEEEFDLALGDDDFDNWRTVGDVVRCIEGKRHG